MKNYFTKAIVCAGVLASALAVNCFCVFAEVPEWEYAIVDKDNKTTASANGYIEGMVYSSNKQEGTYKFTDEVSVTTKYRTSDITVGNNEPTITVPAGYTGQLYMVNASSGDSARELTFTDTTDLSNTFKFTTSGSTTYAVTYTADTEPIPAGKYTVTAQTGKWKYAAIGLHFTATDAPSLVVDNDDVTIQNGSSETVKATLANSSDSIDWTVADDSIATIRKSTGTVANDTCTITGVGVGTTTVTATAGNLSKTIKVTVTKIPAVLTIEPTVSGNTTKYTFTGKDDGDVLTKDSTAAENTAYATDNENTAVEFTAGGAKLVDNNATAPAQLNVPVPSIAAGKLTVKGSVTSSGNTGSSWALVNIGNLVYVGADAKKNICIMPASSISEGKWIEVSPNAGELTAYKETTVTYEVTLDLDNGTFSGDVNGTKYENVEFTKGTVSVISFVTNGSGAGSGARVLTIPSVEYTVEANVEFLAGTVDTKAAVAKVNDKYYAILPISEDTAKEKTSLKLAGQEAEAIYEAVQVTGLSKSAAADFGGSYVYGIEVVPATSGTTTEPTLAQVQDAVTVEFS